MKTLEEWKNIYTDPHRIVDSVDRKRLLSLIDLVIKKDLALKGLLDLMDRGLLVRDVSLDHKPNWPERALALAMEIKKAYEALLLTESLS